MNNSDYTYRPYELDRKETDRRHFYPCVQQIYADANLRLLTKDEVDHLFVGYNARSLDNTFGVDYVCQRPNGTYVFIQSRLKPKRYSDFQDFNLRYNRVSTTKEDTEFRKIQTFFDMFEKGLFVFRNGHKQVDCPFYLVYAFIDDDTQQIIKRVTVNLHVLYYLFAIGKIKPVTKDDKHRYSSYHGYWDEEEQVFYAPIVLDRDKSSNFIAFNVRQMLKHFPKWIWIKAVGEWKF